MRLSRDLALSKSVNHVCSGSERTGFSEVNIALFLPKAVISSSVLHRSAVISVSDFLV